ncbi:hypothetical protein BH10PSE7_BH10PSE7_29460 [soil metagenome]
MLKPLGVTLRDGGVHAAVYSAHAQRIFICLYDGAGETETGRFELTDRAEGVHAAFIPGVEEGARYALRAEGPWARDRGHWFDADKILVDPYARQLDRPFVLASPDVPKGIVRKVPAPVSHLVRNPSVIYEIAVRAFTMRHPGVPENLRGTAGALGQPTVIAYLKTLGIDTVELMPLMAWIDERHLRPLGLHNAWGYNPVTFMAPDPRLAPGGFAEIRAAVLALHEAGISVILDAVYNHTGESDRFGPTLSLRGLDNATYYRHSPQDPGLLINDTGCGNTIDADRLPVRRLIVDSMRCWAEETGIDGFRFDLAPVIGRTPSGFSPEAVFFAAVDADPLLSQLTMIAEPWDVGPEGYQLGNFPAHWREWNDQFRDDVRRFWRGDENTLGTLATRLSGSSDIFAPRKPAPSASINFIAAHDGSTLHDLVTYPAKDNAANGEGNRDGTDQNFSWDAGSAARKESDVRGLLASLFIARGTPMLTAGDEFGRTQRGNNNAYAQDNDLTWLDWEHADQDLTAYVRDLIALRKAHPALSRDRFLTGKAVDASGIPDVMWLDLAGREMTSEAWSDLACESLGMALYDAGDRCCIWMNRAAEAREACPPAPRASHIWRIAAASSAGAAINGAHMSLPARSVVVLEEAAPSSRRGADDDLIAELANAAGIQPVWWTIDGQQTDVSIEVRRTLLKTMDIAAETVTDARDSLHRLRREDKFVRQRPQPECFMPQTILDGRKVFGFATHLYELRGSRDAPLGDFGALREYCAVAAREGAVTAGINPLHHMFPDDRSRVSPYQPSDRRFIDPLYIDLEALARLSRAGAAILQATQSERQSLSRLKYIDYGAAWRIAEQVLQAAFAEFDITRPGDAWRDFTAFCTAEGSALHSHAIYEASRPSRKFAAGSADARIFADRNEQAVRYQQWLQWVADRQMADATGANRSLVYRDLALGTAPDGGEVWSDPGLFARGVSLGSPPDPFSPTGQNWQLAPFKPHVLRERNIEPIADIVRRNMRHAGWMRIDHVLGINRQFWIPQGAEGRDGAYVTFPSQDIIAKVAAESRAANCAIVGEDLGTVPAGLRDHLAAAKMFSYKVLWFERDGDRFKAPETYPYLSLACLGSHDLPTLRGWRAGVHLKLDREIGRIATDADMLARETGFSQEVKVLEETLRAHAIANGDFETDVHELLARSGSALALVQIDDLAGEDMPVNIPGTHLEYPNWRRRNSIGISEIGATPDSRRILDRVRAFRKS